GPGCPVDRSTRLTRLRAVRRVLLCRSGCARVGAAERDAPGALEIPAAHGPVVVTIEPDAHLGARSDGVGDHLGVVAVRSSGAADVDDRPGGAIRGPEEAPVQHASL